LVFDSEHLKFLFKIDGIRREGSNGVRIRTIFERPAASEVSFEDLEFINFFK